MMTSRWTKAPRTTSFLPSFTHEDRVSRLARRGCVAGPRRLGADMVGEDVVDETLAGLEALLCIVVGTEIQGQLRRKGVSGRRCT